MSLLLTFNRFQTLFWCFHFWLITLNVYLSIEYEDISFHIDKVFCEVRDLFAWRKRSMFWKYMFMFNAVTQTWKTRKWDKLFKNGPSKICGRQPLKKLNEYGLLLADRNPWLFLKAVFHKFYLVHSWILWLKYPCILSLITMILCRHFLCWQMISGY